MPGHENMDDKTPRGAASEQLALQLQVREGVMEDGCGREGLGVELGLGLVERGPTYLPVDKPVSQYNTETKYNT